ncbi:MAG: hypothetical protein ACYTGX_05985 [Planctomycetota bacterium]
MVAAILWMGILVLLTLAVAGIWGKYLDEGKLLRLALAPAFLVVLVLKHIACIITGAKAKESKPFGPGDEILTHEEPALPGVGHPLMATLPFLGTIVLFAVANYYMVGWYVTKKTPDLPVFPNRVADIGEFFAGIGAFFGSTYALFHRLAVDAGWQGPVILYLAVSVVLAIRPCYRDVKYLLLSLLVLAGLAFVIEYMGIGFTRRTQGNYELRVWGGAAMASMSLLIATGLSILILSGLTIGLARLGGWAKEGHDKEKARKKSS